MSLERRLRRNQIRMGIIQTKDRLTVLGRNFTVVAFMHGAHHQGYDVGFEDGVNEAEANFEHAMKAQSAEMNAEASAVAQ